MKFEMSLANGQAAGVVVVMQFSKLRSKCQVTAQYYLLITKHTILQ